MKPYRSNLGDLYRLDNQRIGGRFLARARKDSLLYRAQTDHWCPTRTLLNGYRRLFLKGQSGPGIKLAIHLHIVPTVTKDLR
jgi:hypothetical protein